MDILPDAPPGAPLEQQVEQLKPRPGCLLLGIPVLAVLATFVAYVWLFWYGMAGRPATGPLVDIGFEGCAEAQPLVLARIEDMGLGPVEVVPGPAGFSTRLQLPTADTAPEDLAAVLATTGAFELRDGDEVLADSSEIASAGVRLDLTMSPSTLIVLEPEARDRVYARMGEKPEGKLQIWLDGEEVWSFSNRKPSMNGEFEIPPDAADDKARMELAAGRGIALNNGPLPCTLPVSALAPASPPAP